MVNRLKAVRMQKGEQCKAVFGLGEAVASGRIPILPSTTGLTGKYWASSATQQNGHSQSPGVDLNSPPTGSDVSLFTAGSGPRGPGEETKEAKEAEGTQVIDYLQTDIEVFRCCDNQPWSRWLSITWSSSSLELKILEVPNSWVSKQS